MQVDGVVLENVSARNSVNVRAQGLPPKVFNGDGGHLASMVQLPLLAAVGPGDQEDRRKLSIWRGGNKS